MSDVKPPRAGEEAISLPETFDAGLYFIGRIRTPWTTLADCPKNSRGAPFAVGTLEIDARYAAGLKDLETFSHAVVLYWLDRSRRDLIRQVPSHADGPRGVFSLRSPVRPNPIGLAVVELLGFDQNSVLVRNIDCVDGTPLIDVKPYYASLDAVPDARRP